MPELLALIPMETPNPGQGDKGSTLSLLWAPKPVRTRPQKPLPTSQELCHNWGKGPAKPMSQALFLSPPPQKLGHPESLSRSYIRSGDAGSTIRKDQPHSCPHVFCCFSYLSLEAPGPPASVPYPRALWWASGSWGHSSRWAGQQQEAACPHASDTHTPPSCRQPQRVHWAGGQARVQRVAREGRCCHQGTCQGSGTSAQGCPCCNITSGVFSCFIVKQQKCIYTPISLNI